MKKILSCLFVLVLPALDASSTPIRFQSGEKQTALLELYTSEGCSSCPPAEVWLSGLKDSAGLWQDFVPVAFHVDYWDYLGWRDPWAARAYSDRQRAYAQDWRSESIYTPGMVLNGKEWTGWRVRGEGPKSVGPKRGILAVQSSDTNRWQVTFTPGNKDTAKYEVHGALLGMGLVSDVKAGENRGLHLKHDFVVLALTRSPLTKKGDIAQSDFLLSANQKLSSRSLALAFWVTKTGDLEPVQATGGWLPSPDLRR